MHKKAGFSEDLIVLTQCICEEHIAPFRSAACTVVCTYAKFVRDTSSYKEINVLSILEFPLYPYPNS